MLLLLLQVGALLSQGQKNKRRLMFVWSADGSVRPGSRSWARRQQDRRLRQTQDAAAAASAAAGVTDMPASTEQQQQQLQRAATDAGQQVQSSVVAAGPQELMMPPAPPAAAADAAPQPGRLSKRHRIMSFFKSLLPGSTKPDSPAAAAAALEGEDAAGLVAAGAAQPGPSLTTGSAASATTPPRTAADTAHLSDEDLLLPVAEYGSQDDQGDQDVGDNDDDSGGNDDSGVFMYGAAVLGIRGPLTLEPITCQAGQRAAPASSSWQRLMLLIHLCCMTGMCHGAHGACM